MFVNVQYGSGCRAVKQWPEHLYAEVLQSHRNTKTSGNSCIIIIKWINDSNLYSKFSIWYRAPHSDKDINRPSEHFHLNYSAELLQISAKRQTFQMAIGTHATVLPPTPSKETHRIWAIPTSGLGRGWGGGSGPLDLPPSAAPGLMPPERGHNNSDDDYDDD